MLREQDIPTLYTKLDAARALLRQAELALDLCFVAQAVALMRTAGRELMLSEGGE